VMRSGESRPAKQQTHCIVVIESLRTMVVCSCSLQIRRSAYPQIRHHLLYIVSQVRRLSKALMQVLSWHLCQ
jgi:hypothetical protein